MQSCDDSPSLWCLKAKSARHPSLSCEGARKIKLTFRLIRNALFCDSRRSHLHLNRVRRGRSCPHSGELLFARPNLRPAAAGVLPAESNPSRRNFSAFQVDRTSWPWTWPAAQNAVHMPRVANGARISPEKVSPTQGYGLSGRSRIVTVAPRSMSRAAVAIPPGPSPKIHESKVLPCDIS